MALPQVNASITPLELYPDKVTINLQCRSQLRWRDLAKGLKGMGFRQSEGEWTYDLNLRGHAGHHQRGFRLRLSRPRFAAPISCFIDINPLRAFHQQAGGDRAELSAIPSSQNWLPARLIGHDCRFLWTTVDHFIERARDAILDMLAFIHEQARARVAPPVCEHITAHTVECSIDFQANNPRQLVTDFMASFSALLRSNEQREYRPIHVIQPEPDLMIHGFINRSTRLKMYCKTNRRVRFEVQFRPDTFDHYDLTRAIAPDAQTFAMLFERCATISHSHFLDLRSRSMTSLNVNATRTPIDVMIALMAATRRPTVMREVLECLLRTGSIQNSLYDGRLIAALKRRGILVASRSHGFSCFSSQYGYAAALLANAQEDYFTDRLRPPFTAFGRACQQVRRNRRTASYRARPVQR